MKRGLLLAGLCGAILFAGVALPFHATPVFAGGAQSDICQGANPGGGGCGATSGPSLDTVIKVVVNIFSAVVGVTSVVMIISAGFRFVTASGDSGRISSARETMVYAIVGIVIVAFSQFIVQFVLNKVAGTQ